jgi:hypothetical protein
MTDVRDYESGRPFWRIMTVWAIIFLVGYGLLSVTVSQEAVAVFGTAYLILSFIGMLIVIGILQSRAAKTK